MWWQLECLLSVMVFILWNITRKLFNFCRFFSWLVTGTQYQIRKNYRESAYQGTVQMLRIYLRHKFDVLHEPSGVNNFLAYHECFVNPEYVLQDHVTLYYITLTEAIFVETDIGEDATKSDSGSFLRQAQYNLAKKVLIMPMHVFLKLGNQVGKPKAKLIFLPAIGRCGSTMVTQVFEAGESTVGLSEPDSLNAVTQLKGVVPDRDLNQILTCCVNLTYKPFLSRQVNAYVTKPSEPSVALIPHIVALFPESVCVFIYRNGLATARSASRISYTAPLLQLLMLLGQWSASLTLLAFTLIGIPCDYFEERLLSRLHFGSIFWASIVRQYLDFRESGMNIVAIRYEDIVDDRLYVFQKVFEYCGLPHDPEAVDLAMSRDSERGTFISRENTQKYRSKEDEFTEYVKQHTDPVCEKFNVPRFQEDHILPGTISCKEKN